MPEYYSMRPRPLPCGSDPAALQRPRGVNALSGPPVSAPRPAFRRPCGGLV